MTEVVRHTIGGLFVDAAHGEAALKALKAAGFANSQISELANAHDPEPRRLCNPLTTFFRDHTTNGFDFHHNLKDVGMSIGDAKYFMDGIANGGALVTVRSPERSGEASTLLSCNGADLGPGLSLIDEYAATARTRRPEKSVRLIRARAERVTDAMHVSSGAHRNVT